MLRDVPVIDIFAGPGGLAEGLSCVPAPDDRRAFRIRLSIEKDPVAHQTLELRSFVRQFATRPQLPTEYYAYLWGEIERDELFAAFPHEAQRAHDEAWLKTLGEEARPEVRRRINSILDGVKIPWVLVGGPPCQAYSLVGRARMRGHVAGFETDHRHTLYKEYLAILSDHAPDVFVMENVKGLLSSRLHGGSIVEQVLRDLASPRRALRAPGPQLGYRLYALTPPSPRLSLFDDPAPQDFIVRAEEHGVPQCRHRVIIVGIRADHVERLGHRLRPPRLDPSSHRVTVRDAIGDLSPVRSAISRHPDDRDAWIETLEQIRSARWIDAVPTDVRERIKTTAQSLRAKAPASRGGEFFNSLSRARSVAQQLRDARLKGVTSHYARSHMSSDLHRYLFASAFAAVRSVSPKLADFPKDLRPEHHNVEQAVAGSMFSDRFRVQLDHAPSTTITSHIAKDGHYFIHYDPVQARSLTVREAARLQTFPDNYMFEGERTAQYHQVGNAVPPLLARRIGEAVYDVLQQIAA